MMAKRKEKKKEEENLGQAEHVKAKKTPS